MRAYLRRYNAKLRDRMMSQLGAKCSRCGFGDLRALEIDHKNGGGTEERRRLSYPTYYLHVLGNLASYQVLCANCNMIERRGETSGEQARLESSLLLSLILN